MKEILTKILADCDEDIREFLMSDSSSINKLSENELSSTTYFKNWELLPDPAMTALKWQEIRNNKIVVNGATLQ